MVTVSVRRARLLAMTAFAVCLFLLLGPPATAAAPPASTAAAGSGPARPALPLDQQLFGQVQIPAGAVVREDIQMVAGNVQVDGRLTGSVSLAAGQIEVGPAGRIDGSVHLAMGQVIVQPGGSIGGSVVLSGRAPQSSLSCPRGGLTCAVRGTVAHSVTIHPGRDFMYGHPSGSRLLRAMAPWIGWLWFGFHVLSWLGMLALGLPVAALWPNAVEATALQMRRDPGRSVLVGLATAVLALPALLLVSITIIGLPVAFAAAAGLVAVWFFGYIAVWQLAGSATLARAGRAEAHPLLSLAAGSILLFLAGWIPVLGGLVWLAASCLGIGATLLTRFGTGTPWLGRGGTPPPAV